MKRKILLCALSFIAVALFSCGIAFLPNWNPSPTTPPSDIGQEEVTDAETGYAWEEFYVFFIPPNHLNPALSLTEGFKTNAGVDVSKMWGSLSISIIQINPPGGFGESHYISDSSTSTGTANEPAYARVKYNQELTIWSGDHSGAYTVLYTVRVNKGFQLLSLAKTKEINSKYNLADILGDPITWPREYDTDGGFSYDAYHSYYISNGDENEDLGCGKAFFTLVTVDTFSLTYDDNYSGGSTLTTEACYLEKYSIFDNPLSYRPGYTFTGWYTSPTGGTRVTEDTIKTTAEDETLYAHWTPNTYSVQFYRNTSSTDNTTSTQSGFTYDQSKALQANPWTREGYTFKGWSTRRTATTATYTDKQSVKNLTDMNGRTFKLYAVWARNNYYVDVNNYLDGGANDSAISHGLSFSVKVDGVVKGTGLTDFYYGDIPYNSKVEVYDIKIGSGYSYSSYTVSPSGYEQSGSSKSHIIVTTPAQQININLYFVTNSYTLTVNPNGGTWNGSSSSQNFTQNYNTTKAIANPVRYGYYFDRWALSGSGSLNGTTFTFGGGDCTLTANWIETWAVNYTKPSGSGTASSPYQVDSASDLAYFAYKTQILGEQCFDHIVLTKDIDLAGYDWMPIGTGRNVVSGVQPYFRGTFDGQGHTISNLNINVEGYQELNEFGLFGLIDVDAVLKNFTILSGEVNGSAKVGGAVGWLWSASVENVINYANINGSSYVGGIVGNYHSWEGNFVRECQNYGTITGTNYTAGIVGGGDDSSGMQNIVDCVNYGTIKGASFTGGIVGNIVKVKMSGCVNYGSISGQDRVGGIAGRVNNNSVVSELVNYGDVTGWTMVAGILGGAAYADSATSCFNLGNIKGESHIGGVIGYVYDGITLTNSANFGNITGTITEVGGLIGLVESSSACAVIQNNGSEGAVVGTGATNVGGLIGRAGGTNVIENNYLNMSSTTQSIIGAGTISGTYIYVLNVNGTTYKRYHGSVTGFVWVSGSPCPIPKEFSWAGEHLAQVTTTDLANAGFTSI